MANGDDVKHHISPPVTNVLALLAVVVSVWSVIQSMPTGREFERIWKSIDEHHALPGHAGVLARVAEVTTGLESLKTALIDEQRQVSVLMRIQEKIISRESVNRSTIGRLDESLRHIDLSVPSLSDRLSTTEANLKASMARIGMLERLQRGEPSIQTDRGARP